MALFFTADTHFGDQRTIDIHRRPFANAAEMEEAFVASGNAVVGPEDEVWYLGDVARWSADVAPLLAQLNGTKHLVLGNNDEAGAGEATGWASVHNYARLAVESTWLVLCHYLLRRGNGQHRRSMNLHSHSRSKLKPLPRSTISASTRANTVR